MRFTTSLNSYIAILTFFLINCLGAQSQINLELFDKNKNEIFAASIVAANDSIDSQVISYTSKSKDGIYHIDIPSHIKLDSIWLTIRHVSYRTKKIFVLNKSQFFSIELQEDKNLLDEIFLEAQKSLIIKGDTLSFDTQSLQKQQDYTIEDVIARIPGVSIKQDGSISYNGRLISHFYINGLNLLEGKYNLATRGIPATAVEDIQVLTKHNHARIDQGRTNSDKVAINITVDKENVIFGSLKGDVGIPFPLYNVEATPIFINKKFQNLSTTKTNQIGTDLSVEGNKLTPLDYSIKAISQESITVLREPNTTGQAISEKYWRDNTSYSFSNDLLFKNDQSTEYKLGLGYNQNDNEFLSTTNSTYFLGNEQVVVNNQSQNVFDDKNFTGAFVIEENKKEKFAKNKFYVNLKNANGSSSNLLNDQHINYLFNREQVQIENTYEIKKTVGNTLFSNVLIAQYHKTNEESSTSPIVFPSQISSTPNSESTLQNIELQSLNFGLSSQFNFRTGNLNWNVNQKLFWRTEQFESSLFQEPQQTEVFFPFKSDFKLNTLKSNSDLATSYRYKKFLVSFNTSLEYNHLTRSERFDSESDLQDDFLFFQPRLSLNYKFNNDFFVNISSSFNSKISQFSNLFPSVVLQDYLSLNLNPTQINKTTTQTNSLYSSYKNIIKGFYANIRVSSTKSVSDFTFTSTINDNGLNTINAIERDNQVSILSITTDVTKKIADGMLLTADYNFSNNQTETFFNGTLLDINNQNHKIGLKWSFDTGSWYGFEFNGNYEKGISSFAQISNSNENLRGAFDFSFYLNSKSRWNIGGELIRASFSGNSSVNTNSLFNSSYHYQPSKKLKLRFEILNIFDINNYTIINNSANFTSQYQYQLRPRQFNIGFTYTL